MKKKLSILCLLSCIASCLLFSGCKKTPEIVVETGDRVTLTYSSYLLDGEIIDNEVSETIVVGWGDSFPIFEKELLGMKAGEEKTFTTIDPKDGYGIFYEEGNNQEISSTLIYNMGINSPKEGDSINLGGYKGIITKVYPATVNIDFNERKTRENAEFNVKIISIDKNTATAEAE